MATDPNTEANQPFAPIEQLEDLDTPWGDAGVTTALTNGVANEEALGRLENLPAVEFDTLDDDELIRLVTFDEVFAELDQVNERINLVEEDIDERVLAEVRELDDEIDYVYRYVDTQYDNLQADIEADFDEKLAKLRLDVVRADESDTAYLEGRMDSMWDHLFDIDHAISGIDSRVDGTEQELTTLSDAVTMLDNLMADRDGRMLRSFDAIRVLAQHVRNLDSEVAELRLENEELRAKQRDNSGIMSEFVQNAADVMSDALFDIERSREALTTIADDVRTQLLNHGDSLQRLWSNHSTLRSQFESAAQQIDRLTDTSDQHGKTLATHTDVDAAQETRLERVEQSVHDIAINLNGCFC